MLPPNKPPMLGAAGGTPHAGDGGPAALLPLGEASSPEALLDGEAGLGIAGGVAEKSPPNDSGPGGAAAPNGRAGGITGDGNDMSAGSEGPLGRPSASNAGGRSAPGE